MTMTAAEWPVVHRGPYSAGHFCTVIAPHQERESQGISGNNITLISLFLLFVIWYVVDPKTGYSAIIIRVSGVRIPEAPPYKFL